MAKNSFRTITTQKGQCLYAYLDKPEVFEGKEMGYSIQFKTDKEGTDKLIKAIHEELEAAKASPEFRGKKWSSEPFLGYREKDGDIIFKFKASTSYKTRTGEVMQRHIPVFDSQNHEVTDKTMGNGSTVRINFTIIPFNMNARMNGVSLRLNAVQLINLVPFGQQSAAQYGFGTEEGGYSVEDKKKNDVFDEVEEEGEF